MHQISGNLKEILLNIKGQINTNTIIVGENIPLSQIERLIKPKINKKCQLNHTFEQKDLMHI